MEHWVVPGLHIKLGLTLNVLHYLIEFAKEKIETYPSIILDLKEYINQVKTNIDQLKDSMVESINGNNFQSTTLKSILKDYKRIKKTIQNLEGNISKINLTQHECMEICSVAT
jgi:hypothetical protein